MVFDDVGGNDRSGNESPYSNEVEIEYFNIPSNNTK